MHIKQSLQGCIAQYLKKTVKLVISLPQDIPYHIVKTLSYYPYPSCVQSLIMSKTFDDLLYP